MQPLKGRWTGAFLRIGKFILETNFKANKKPRQASNKTTEIKKDSQSVGFEPTLPEGIWFLVRRLNRSATTASYLQGKIFKIYTYSEIAYFLQNYRIIFSELHCTNLAGLNLHFVILQRKAAKWIVCITSDYITHKKCCTLLFSLFLNAN
jgi:hypothetical protein